MSVCLVTGAAGFIGSHLCESLLSRGHEVIGVDAFIPYYPREIKVANLERARDHDDFTFHELDVRTAALQPLLGRCDTVFHLAAMAGLVRSWTDFPLYSSCNAEGTQHLLQAACEVGVEHVLHVSTSSVYGKEATGSETAPLRPFSPYGITKLAAENLCAAYRDNFGLPVTVLRYFSVYGPRQRPDMAYHILIEALMEDRPFPMYGDGEQTRSNTFVGDCVAATLLAFEQRAEAVGETFNIGGGEVVSLNQVLAQLESLTGKKARIERLAARPGDQKHTAADITKAGRILGYRPSTPVAEGLAAQVAWHRSLR